MIRGPVGFVDLSYIVVTQLVIVIVLCKFTIICQCKTVRIIAYLLTNRVKKVYCVPIVWRNKVRHRSGSSGTGIPLWQKIHDLNIFETVRETVLFRSSPRYIYTISNF